MDNDVLSMEQEPVRSNRFILPEFMTDGPIEEKKDPEVPLTPDQINPVKKEDNLVDKFVEDKPTYNKILPNDNINPEPVNLVPNIESNPIKEDTLKEKFINNDFNQKETVLHNERVVGEVSNTLARSLVDRMEGYESEKEEKKYNSNIIPDEKVLEEFNKPEEPKEEGPMIPKLREDGKFLDESEQKDIERELLKEEIQPLDDAYFKFAPVDEKPQPYKSLRKNAVKVVQEKPNLLAFQGVNAPVDFTKQTPKESSIPFNVEEAYLGNEKIEVPEVTMPDIARPKELEEENSNKNVQIQGMIDTILGIPLLEEVEIPKVDPIELDRHEAEIPTFDRVIIPNKEDKYVFKDLDATTDVEITKDDLVEVLSKKAEETHGETIIGKYGEDFTVKQFVTNPAIGRSEEIKQLILILLTPEKSAILTGKPGIGKTSIVEGLAYALQRDNVPDKLKGYTIVNIKTASLLGSLPSGETRLQTLVDELKKLDKVILFIDEIHMLIGSTNDSALDFANMFKESLGRGSIKVIGATTTEEYERYILKDKAFVRRFQKVEVLEPDREQTIKIVMGTLPKIEKNTGAKLKYTHFMQTEIVSFIVDITSEFKRIYGIGSRYPDICITLMAQAYSQAVFDDRKEVNIFDIRNAIQNSKNIYPDVIMKELINFDVKFKDLIKDEKEGLV